jgi:tetratricopeptide (TPR) repeat protein
MKTPAPADLQRWSEELARNPASLAFLPLARAYRRQGRGDLALSLCLRGLEEHPSNVEAHALLALLYLERGDREKAADEWSIVLRLKPGNFEALRGMGFRYLEQDDIPRARQHLERAALIRPDDTAVQEALRLLRQRETAAAAAEPPARFMEPEAAPPFTEAADEVLPELQLSDDLLEEAAALIEPAIDEEPWNVQTEPEPWATPTTAETEPWQPFMPAEEHTMDAPVSVPLNMPEPVPVSVPETARVPVPALPDPAHVFDTLIRGPILGILLLDTRGLVLAGALGAASGRPDELGAIIGGAIDEAKRTVSYLDLGSWRGILMEAAAAMIYVSPVTADTMVVLAARTDAPAGWVLRTADHAGRTAARFLESYA